VFISFLLDRKAESLLEGSLRFYDQVLQLFSRFCESQAMPPVMQILPKSIL
jgi:hypothetical protein